MPSSICIPNMTLLACKVVEKSLTKECYGITEGRMDGRTDGRTDGMTDRCEPVYPPLLQSGGINISRGVTFPFKVPIQKIINFFRLIHSTIVFAESFFESSTSLSDILHFKIFYISCENIYQVFRVSI